MLNSKKIVLFSVLVLVFITGCIPPQSSAELRAKGTKVSFDSNRSYEQMTQMLNKYVPKCASRYVQNGPVTLDIEPTLNGDANSAELVLTRTMKATFPFPQETVDYFFAADINKTQQGGVHIDMYKTSKKSVLEKAVKAWSEGRKGCPDYTY